MPPITDTRVCIVIFESLNSIIGSPKLDALSHTAVKKCRGSACQRKAYQKTPQWKYDMTAKYKTQNGSQLATNNIFWDYPDPLSTINEIREMLSVNGTGYLCKIFKFLATYTQSSNAVDHNVNDGCIEN